jgi:hypothetical protein
MTSALVPSDFPTKSDVNRKLFDLQEPLRTVLGWELIEERYGTQLEEDWEAYRESQRSSGTSGYHSPNTSAVLKAPRWSSEVRRYVPASIDDSSIRSIVEESNGQARDVLQQLSSRIDDMIPGNVSDLEEIVVGFKAVYLQFGNFRGTESGAADVYTLGNLPPSPASLIKSFGYVHSGLTAIREVCDEWQGEDATAAREKFGDDILPEAIHNHQKVTHALLASAVYELAGIASILKSIENFLDDFASTLYEEVEMTSTSTSVSLALGLAALVFTPIPPAALALSIASAAVGIGEASGAISEDSVVEFPKYDKAKFDDFITMFGKVMDESASYLMDNRKWAVRAVDDFASDKVDPNSVYNVPGAGL